MAKQPIKPNVNIENQFSIELTNIIQSIRDFYLLEYPDNHIGIDLFVAASLENEGSFLNDCLTTVLSKRRIISISREILNEIKESGNIVSGEKRNKKVPFSAELMSHFNNALKFIPDYNTNVITSDLVFLSIYKETESYQKKFIEYGLDLETLEDSIATLHQNRIEIELPTALFDAFTGMDNNHGIFIGPQDVDAEEIKSDNISSYTVNLNELSQKNKIDELIGREKEISAIANVLNRRKCNNAVLVGDAGVGKTHIIEGIAKQIEDGIAPVALKNKVIYRINWSEMISGTQYRGVFESRVNSLIKEFKNVNNAILFFDDIHNMLSDKYKNDFDLIGLMNDMFKDNNVQVIATTTYKGYKQAFEKNDSLKRSFQKIDIMPPTTEECFNIISNIAKYYEQYHCVKYTREALNACVLLSKRYITDRNLPTSAIDLLDISGAQKKLNAFDNEELRRANYQLYEYQQKKNEVDGGNDITESNSLAELINSTKLTISKIQNKLSKEKKDNGLTVNLDDIYSAVSQQTNIPVSKMNVSEKKSVANIDKVLKTYIIGQDEAIDKITQSIKRSKVGLYPSNKPSGSFLCVGNSGVGKTLMAKKLAKEIFGDEKYLVRFDMSEYADKTAVNKLIGASAGYVGFEKGGLLTEAIKKQKHCVLLIDEIEKANEEIFNLFLQVLDEGFLTDNDGYKVDFKNTIIILTSNIGTKKASLTKSLGFNADDTLNKRSIIEREIKDKFSPEFLNRLTDIIYFNQLTDDNLIEIIKLELNKLANRVKGINHNLTYNNDVIDYLFKKLDKNRNYGARPIGKLIQDEIENRLTDIILQTDSEKLNFNVEIDENNTLNILTI